MLLLLLMMMMLLTAITIRTASTFTVS